ncbi:MAG: hypothetical protein V7784_14955 [Oceanospirillaceae bacterium]
MLSKNSLLPISMLCAIVLLSACSSQHKSIACEKGVGDASKNQNISINQLGTRSADGCLHGGN